MRSKTDNADLQLPGHLRERFRDLEQRLWRVDTIIAVCGALSGLLLSYLLVFLSDRLWDTPLWIRTLLMLVGVGVLLYFVTTWFKLWVLQPRDYRALSVLVQTHFRKLGDRLLGIVELANVKSRPPNISPALCRAAIQQVSTEAIKFDFRDAVATRRPRMFFIAAVLLLALFLAPWIIFPQASWNAMTRWVWPGANVARYTFVSLEQLPDRLVVPHGEAFEIQCGIKANSFWRPRRAVCQFEGQPSQEAPFSGNKAVFRIAGQTRPGKLALKVGDVRREVRVEPMHRPALRKLLARVQPPAYLQHVPADEEVRNGSVTVLEGSRVSFKGIATRPLASAEMQLHSTNDFAADTSTNQTAPSEPLTIEGEEFRSMPLVLDQAGTATFVWRDQFKLAGAAPWPLAIQSKPDEAPQVECPDQPAVVAMLEEEAIEIKLAAQDDFGLREMGLSWECQQRQETNEVIRRQVKVQEGHPRTNSLFATYRFAPSLLHLPADSVVTLRATAADYLPGRQPAQSAIYKIFIVSEEEHAQVVQQQFEKIAAEIEELTRREEALEEATRETKESSADKLAAEETAKKVGEQANEQSEIARKMEQLNRMAAETMREAMRNKSIPAETLKEWTGHMESMQNLAQSQMPQAAQSLSQAQNNPEQRQQQLQQANQQEQEIVKALQEMQKKMSSTLDQMLANTLAQRLRKIAKTQKNIGQDLQKNIGDTIGLPAEQLPTGIRDKGILLAANQEQAGKHTHVLGEEISRFYDRTSATNYGTVAREIKETDAGDSLTRNAELIRRNIAAQALEQTGSWSHRFNQWAELLEAARKSEGGGSGSGGGQISEEAIKRLLALLRLRQEEVNVRDLTTWLEQHKQTHTTYRDDTVMLSLRQSLLVDDAGKLEEEAPGKYLPEAKEAMKEADGFLRKPQTDQPVVNVETDAINLLESEIMSMFKQCNNPSQSAALAMLMEMMGMSVGQSGRGSYAGGEAEKSGENVKGDPKGSGGDTRGTDRTAGRDLRSVPAEFRDALQNYYKGLERLNQ